MFNIAHNRGQFQSLSGSACTAALAANGCEFGTGTSMGDEPDWLETRFTRSTKWQVPAQQLLGKSRSTQST